MLCALLIGRKTRVVEHVGPAAQFKKLRPLSVIIGDDRDEAVLRRIRPPTRVHRTRIAHAAIAGDEGFAPQIFDHVEPGEAFEHGHLNKLSALPACTRKQCRHGCIGREQTADFIRDKAGRIGRTAAIALLA